MGDGFINAPWYQKAARCLTYNTQIRGKQEADIIRISFQAHNLASELFLVENPVIDRTIVTLEKMMKQLERSSFTNITFDDVEDMTIGTIMANADSANDVLETALKYSDTTKYIMAQLVDEDLNIDEDLAGMNATKGSVISSLKITLPNKTKKGESVVIVPGSKLKAKDEKALEVYIDIVRLLPYVANVFNCGSLNEFLKMDWKDKIIIDKDEFKHNLKNRIFNSIVKTMFRNINKDYDIISEKVTQYAMFID